MIAVGVGEVHGARDFGSGLPLHSHLLGHLASLQVHHIFPKAVLYAAGYHRSQVNFVANFCFLTQDTNLAIGKQRPADYFREAESKHPGVLASQWIPQDPALWEIENYTDFLAARRELLADAANTFLTGLRSAVSPDTSTTLERVAMVVDAPDEEDSRADEVAALIAELTELGGASPGPEVRAAFELAMKDVYARAKQEANYTAGYFLTMLSNYGGLGTAHRLLASPEVSTGFTALYERGRLDLTVEALVVKPEFAGLFTEDEVEAARERLRQLGYL
ncbi:MAG: hypothetical protein M3Y33_01675 [Actinomycetota bacterium]|nr:hypothetical protein [Actinomycetota bacterium]